MMRTRWNVVSALMLFTCAAHAQSRTSVLPVPQYSYSLSVDTADLTSAQVVISFENFPDTFSLAAVVHPEYDNKFWRNIRDLRATGSAPSFAQGIVSRLDSTLWRVAVRGGRGLLSYSVAIHPEQNPDYRAAWHPFLRSTGALLPPTDLLLYFPDIAVSSPKLELQFPVGWKLATGLTQLNDADRICFVAQGAPRKCSDHRKLTATSAANLLDSPILLGDLHSWDFTVHRIPHHIYYWPLPTAKPFDTAAFASRVEGIAREAMAVFEKAPYSEYSFLFQDGAWGALEHHNSVTIGIPSADLATDVNAYLVEIAHESFHTWNLMAIRPAGWGKLSYKKTGPTTGLWFSEGVTMYYAYLLPRRIGFPEQNHTRIQQLEEDLGSYFSNPGNTHFSPEQASLLADAAPSALSDYQPDYYLVGRLIGEALELIINDSTRGQHGLDEVMRRMYSKHAGPRGFVATDISNAVSNVCKCDMVPFFRDHVSGARALDFNKYLPSLSLRVTLDTVPEADSAGTPYPDTRIWARASTTGGRAKAILFSPNSVWAKAGIHTGDELVSFNGVRVDSMPDMRRAMRSIKLNEVVPVEIFRSGKTERINVTVTGYTKVRARITSKRNPTRAQLEKRERWLRGRLARDETPKRVP